MPTKKTNNHRSDFVEQERTVALRGAPFREPYLYVSASRCEGQIRRGTIANHLWGLACLTARDQSKEMGLTEENGKANWVSYASYIIPLICENPSHGCPRPPCQGGIQGIAADCCRSLVHLLQIKSSTRATKRVIEFFDATTI